jgi:hypothetical protein
MRNLYIVTAALVFAVLFSLGGECGATHIRHSRSAYDGTITVYKSNSFALPLFFTANDTVTGSFTVVSQKHIDLFVMDTFNYRHSTHDSAHSEFARTDTSYSDIFLAIEFGDTFHFEFVNHDPDSLHKVLLQLNRVYWETQ